MVEPLPHRCADARDVLKESFELALSKNVTRDGVVNDILTNLGQLGWCLIRAEDV